MIKTAKLNRRHEQLKRELMGLATGTVLCLTGLAFLFNQTLWGDDPADETAPTIAAASFQTPAALAAKDSKPVAVSSGEPADIVMPQAEDVAEKTVAANVVPETSVQVALDNVATISPESKHLALKDIINAPEVTLTALPVFGNDGVASKQERFASAEDTAIAAEDPESEEALPVAETGEASSQPEEVSTNSESGNQAEELAETAEPESQAQEATANADNSGWIYAGQFVDGKWAEQGLRIGNELPVSGKQYSLNWGATVRDNPPGRSSGAGKLGRPIANLSSGRDIEILQVKESGKRGHIWLEIRL